MSSASAPRLIATYTLPRASLSNFGNPAITEAVLARARKNGLKFSDLPSIGSGLASASTNEFWGLTDRGPNGTAGKDEERRTFPLPEFCPTIVRLKLSGDALRPTRFIPITDAHGQRVSGLSNLKTEERLFESADAKRPLPLDENGVDPEALRVLPDGRFLVSEEYSPSLLVISQQGEVMMRYTPVSKTLPRASYPVKAILPGIFAQRRSNKGFENLALSPDGRFAFLILQCPMGDTDKKRFAESRVLRVLKLDLANPLDAKVVGEFLALASPARTYSAKQKQASVSWSDAEWLAPDVLLVLERAKGEARLLKLDLHDATNLLGRADENGLELESTTTDLARLKIEPAATTTVFSTRNLAAIDSDKLEGLVVLNSTDLALANDNDFGLGDNTTGEPSKIWIIRLAHPLTMR